MAKENFMRKSLKQLLSLLLIAVIVSVGIPMMSYAESTKGDLTVTADGRYVTSATVTNLPSPYPNGNYLAFCADEDKDISPNHKYTKVNFSEYSGSHVNAINYLFNTNFNLTHNQTQEVVWAIINDDTNFESTAARNVWRNHFADEKWFLFTYYENKSDGSFPNAATANYDKIVFIAEKGNNQPIFVLSTKKYTVVFKDFNGTTLKTEVVDKGSNATAPTTPDRTGYNFTGWDTGFTNIQSNTVVTAQYAIKTFTVEFKNYDNSLVKTETVEYDKDATAPANPSQPGHTFREWDQPFTHVKSNLVVNALFDINQYTVRFLDKDGALIDTDTVDYNTAATAPTAPTVTGHTFSDWDKTFSNVTENMDVQALYNINQYTVKFYNGEDLVDTQTVNYGSAATAPADPSGAGKTFTGWDTPFNNIVRDTDVHALFSTNTYTVTFVDYDDSVLKSQEVEYGQGASAPALDARPHFTFDKWDKDFSNITESITVKAMYNEDPKGTLTVNHEFSDDSTKNSTSSSSDYYGESYATSPVAHEGYTYTVSGSESGVYGESPITVTYTYTLIPEPVNVTVKFDTNGGSDAPADQTFAEGGTASQPADPSKSGFTFDYWMLGETEYDFTTPVTADITLVAHYTIEQLPTETEAPSETVTPSETEAPTQPATEAPTEPVGPQGSVIVNYVDTEGNTLGSSFSFSGTVGTLYQTSSRAFEGFTLIETPSNASGSFIDGSVTVDYVYSNGEIVVDEETPLGEAVAPFNFDSIYDNVEITTEAEEIIVEEETPLADALPQTGQASPELFYGIGSLITAAGIFLKKREK